MTKPADLPSYGAPPLIEVVCGVQFHSLDLLQAHLGLLWQKFLPDYPGCTETPPLPLVIERFEETGRLNINVSDVPPLARTWFVHKDNTGIIQVQPNRFLHNWKKVKPSDEYPRHSSVIDMFRRHFAAFREFVEQHGVGPFQPVQYELTYVNHIPQGDGWDSTADLHKVFPDFCFRNDSERFLPALETFNWRTSFVLPRSAGRLHASMSGSRASDGTPVLAFELTARGFSDEESDDAMWAWFGLAHEWVVRGFSDLTGEDLQKTEWKRTS